MNGEHYDAKRYWNERASIFGDIGSGLKAVGAVGLSDHVNLHGEKLIKKAIFESIKISPGMKVLDIGCGVGRWSIEFAKRGAKVTGIDVSVEMVKIARKRAENQRIACEFFVKSVDEIDFPSENFDLVVSVATLYYVTNQEMFEKGIKEIVRVARKNGHILLVEWAPNKSTSIPKTSHLACRTFEEQVKLFSEAGAELVIVRGVSLIPLTHYTNFASKIARFVFNGNTDKDEFLHMKLHDSIWLKLYNLGAIALTFIYKPIDYYLMGISFFSKKSDTKLMIFRRI